MKLEFKTLFKIAQRLTSIRESGKNSVSPQELEKIVNQIEPVEGSPYAIERYLIEEGILFQLREGWTGPVKAVLIHKDAVRNLQSKHEDEYAEMKKAAESAEDSMGCHSIQYATLERHGEGLLFDFLKKLESKYPCGTKIPCTALSKEWTHPTIKWAAVRLKVLEILELVDPTAAYVKYEYKIPFNWDVLIESKGLKISDKVRFSHLKEGVTPSDDVIRVVLSTLGTPLKNVLNQLQKAGYTSTMTELPKVINSWDFAFHATKDTVGVESIMINGYPAILWYRHQYLGIDLPSPKMSNTVIQATDDGTLLSKTKLSLKWEVVFTYNNKVNIYQLEFNKYDPEFDWDKLRKDLEVLNIQCVGTKSGVEGMKSITSLKALIELKSSQIALLDDI